MTAHSSEIGVAVIGGGMIGGAHAFAYMAQHTVLPILSRRVRLVKAVDSDIHAAKALAQRFGFENAGTNWKEILSDSRIGVVSIALPNFLHYEVAKALLQAGKHVLCEKPLAVSPADAWDLVRVAERAGRVAATSFNYRRIPAVAEARRQVNANSFGAPVVLNCYYHADYCSDPSHPFSWRYQKRLAGAGALADLGVHAIDMMRCMCGNVRRIRGATLLTAIDRRRLPATVVKGHAKPALLDEDRPVDTDDVAHALLEFENGCIGNLSVSRIAVGSKNQLGFALNGLTGSVWFDFDRPSELNTAHLGSEGVTRQIAAPHFPYAAEGQIVVAAGVPTGYVEYFTFMVREFLDAIEEGKPFANGSFRDGYETALVIMGIERAAETASSVNIGDLRATYEHAGERSA
jgi:predicted dehydrogenase